ICFGVLLEIARWLSLDEFHENVLNSSLGVVPVSGNAFYHTVHQLKIFPVQLIKLPPEGFVLCRGDSRCLHFVSYLHNTSEGTFVSGLLQFFFLCGKMPSAPGFLSGMTSSPLARAKLPKFLIEYGCCLSIQLLDLYPRQKEHDPSAAVHRHLRNADFSRARVAEV